MALTDAPGEQADEKAWKAAREALQRYWGYADFRPGQADVIRAVLQGRDVLAVLPTGGGKSICYQVPALLGKGLTLVVSPLIALMQDQVAHLKAHGISAAYINSTLPATEVDQRWTDAEFGRYKLLYVAPERLQSDLFVARAERLNVTRLAIDEAHCVSEWGHHFRPAYLQIPEARARLGDPPVLAVTATATPYVRRDIVEHLALRAPEVLVKGFDRPNLVWSIFHTENKRSKVQEVLDGVPGCGLLYATTRRGVEAWAEWLMAEGETAAAYHAGLSSAARAAAQEAWVRGDVRLMVATNAFGMGIDKPDVRFVIHVDLPASLEAYYQEAGRGGRDGRRAYAVLLYRPRDEATQQALIEEGHPDALAVQQVYTAVCNLAQLPLGSLPDGPLAVDVEAVARLTGFSYGKVATAVTILDRQAAWQVLPPRRHRGLLRFRQSAAEVRAYQQALQNQKLAAFVDALLRTVHADAFLDWWEIDLRMLERRAAVERKRLYRGLDFLKERGLLDWRGPDQSLQVVLQEPRTQKMPVDDLAVRRALRRARVRLDDMLRYTHSVTCRRHFLLGYFGEKSPARCGRCDVCLGRHEAVVVTPADEPVMRHILEQVARQTPQAGWFTDAALPAHRAQGLTDWLIQESYLRVADALAGTFELTPKAHAFLEQWQPRASATSKDRSE